jgi:hypothetical protein
MLRRARRGRRGSRSRRGRPRAGSNRGWDRPSQVQRGVHRGCPGCKPAVGHGQPGAAVRPEGCHNSHSALNRSRTCQITRVSNGTRESDL